MIYVQQSLVPGEKIVFGGFYHWMYTFSALSWIFIGFIMAFIVIHSAIFLQFQAIPPSDVYLEAMWSLHPYVRIGAFCLFVFGLFQCFVMLAIKATTEIAVTDRRLIIKRGIIARHVDEMSVDRIEGVVVQQGIFGRIFGYGQVIVRGMGVGAIVLPAMIENPIALRQAVDKAREL